MTITHTAVKATGDTGLATEWNDNHVIAAGTITGAHLEDPLTDDHEFSNFPTTPNAMPTLDRQVANKQYVDQEAVLRKGWAGYAFENGGGWTTKKTITIPAGFCHKRSMLVIRLQGDGTAQYRVRIMDGANSSFSLTRTLAGTTLGDTIMVSQPNLQHELRYSEIGQINEVVFGNDFIDGLMNLDMFEDAFTIEIRVNRTGGGTAYVEWGVFIIEGS